MSLTVLDALTRRGGVARRAELIDATSRTAVDAALREGWIAPVARGVYASAEVDHARRVAGSLTGVVSHLSAALHHGWAVKTPPQMPEVAIPRGRNPTAAQHRRARISRARLGPDDVESGVTSRDRTLLDCLRREDFDSGLAVADSAIRDGFSQRRLVALMRDARGPQVPHMRRVAQQADGLAANPFESVLRAISRDVAGLNLRPQVPVFGPDFLGRPDLVDADLRIIAEADSFAWHGDRAALRSDARRYDQFVVHGWLVLRFCWEDVMFEPEWVRSVLTAATRLRLRHHAS